MLTWTDIVKLSVPFFFSLLLIWAKDYYEKNRERKAKHEYLWRTISQGIDRLSVALSELDKICVAFKGGRIRLVEFDIPANLTEFSNRLGELDSANAYVYSDYTSQMEIVRKGLAFLKSLIADFITTNQTSRTAVAKGIETQAKNIKKDLLGLARQEIDVLRTIQKSHPKKYDAQVINKYTIVVGEEFPQQPIA